MKNKIILESLAMDLKRVAQGYYRGSEIMAERFMQEARAREKELQSANLKPYLKKLLSKLENMFEEKDQKKLAEDALMYSTLFQNASLKEWLDV